MAIRTALSVFAAAGLLAGCGAVLPGGPERVSGGVYDGQPVDQDPSDLRAIMIDRHNAARRAVGSPPLSWDATLVQAARGYAEQLARSGRFEHSDNASRPGQGENLWVGTRGGYAYAEMVGHWIEEQRYFRRGTFPNNSTTGNWSDVGHYTQIIWRTTSRVGCAIASNNRDDYLVCRYAPQGNIVGRDPLTG